MFKRIFLLLSMLLIISGCAERGYTLTKNIDKHTVTAQRNIDLGTQNTKEKESQELDKMKTAVKKVLKKQNTAHTIPVLDEDDLLFSDTQDLHFVRVNKTYQKFGDSELHGHLIYLSKLGEELRLSNTHVYLLSNNKKIEHWYTHAYLKNKTLDNREVTVKYLNSTYLNLNKNFAFHGIAPGTYYVVIVSNAPHTENKKVYIAKKMNIEKRKKIMAVFSKKL